MSTHSAEESAPAFLPENRSEILTTPVVEAPNGEERLTDSPVSSSRAGHQSARSSPSTTDNSTPFDDVEEDSSCSSTSSTGNTSTTMRDVYSNCSNDNSSGSPQDASSDQAQRTKAVFDKVVLDAMQRQQIRTKHACRNTSKDYDTESDSSSGTADPKPLKSSNANSADLKRSSIVPASAKRLRVSDSGVSSEQHDISDQWCSLPNSGESEHRTKQPSMQAAIATRGHRTAKRVHHHHRVQEKRHRPIPEENSPSTSSSGSDEEQHQKQRRFFQTFSVLRECGLMDVTMQTAALMERNRKIKDEIAELRRETETTYQQMIALCQKDPVFAEQTETQVTVRNLCKILNKEDEGCRPSQTNP